MEYLKSTFRNVRFLATSRTNRRFPRFPPEISALTLWSATVVLLLGTIAGLDVSGVLSSFADALAGSGVIDTGCSYRRFYTSCACVRWASLTRTTGRDSAGLS